MVLSKLKIIHTKLIYFVKQTKGAMAVRFHCIRMRQKLKIVNYNYRPCCAIKEYQILHSQLSKCAFSQLNYLATSNIVAIQNIPNIPNGVSCPVCIENSYNQTELNLYTNVEFFRNNLSNLELLKQLPTRQYKNLFICFTENTDFSIVEIDKYRSIFSNFFVENCQEAGKNIYPLPIGFRDGKELQPNSAPMSERYYNEINYNIPSKSLILAAFSTWTNSDRKFIRQVIEQQPGKFTNLIFDKTDDFVIPTGKIHPRRYKNFLLNHKFTICPAGAGIDTHRFYESIMFNSLPLVIKTHSNFDLIYQLFPCHVLSEWEDLLHLTFDQKIYEIYQERRSRFLEKFPGLHINASNIKKLFELQY